MDQDSVYGNMSSSTDELLKTQFPLHHACRDGDLETLSNLLSSGNYNLFEEDSLYGWSPVHWAAHFGKLTCLMRLLEHGARFDSTTSRFNQTPAHIAAFRGKGHCLKWLLHCGAMINRQLACVRNLTSLDNDGTLCHRPTSRFRQTPLHLASLRDHPHCAQWIIQSGANIEVQDYLGETPVHKAARTGSMECVSLLVSQGCKLSIRNHNNQTPSQVAVECGYQECANYLERASQMQLQAEGVYNELRMPVTQTNPNNSNTIPNGVGGPRSETRTNPCFVMQGLNGGIVPEADGNGITDDCDMMEDGCMQEDADMFLRAGVKRGRDDLEEECFKRMRRAGPTLLHASNSCPPDKPMTSDYCSPGEKHFLNLNHDKIMQGVNNNYENSMFSSSALEHYSSICVQQGYENLCLDSLISNAHGT